MPIEEFSMDLERETKKQYAEDIYEYLPEVEIGADIPRVHVTRLSAGRETFLKLSEEEALRRDGWNLKNLNKVKTGDIIMNADGEKYKVLEVSKKKIKIKGIDSEYESIIVAHPTSIRAHEYSYSLTDDRKNAKKIKVFDTLYMDQNVETIEFLDTVIGSIPTQCMDVFDEIEIHRGGTGDGHFRVESSLFSDRNVLAIYISSRLFFDKLYPTKEATEVLYHELGHAIVKKIRGSRHPGSKWTHVMHADGNSVSKYADRTQYTERRRGEEADRGEIEDFAESVRLYLATDGAKSDSVQNLRSFCKNRFEKLDEVFEDLARRQAAGKLKRLISSPQKSLK